MPKPENVRLVHFDESFLDHSWEWLNDPEIKHLTNAADFTREDQQKWFLSLGDNETYLIWGITFDGRPAGACGIKNITADDCEYWGYIGDKSLWGKGLGKELLLFMEEKALEMGKKTIWLRVIKENRRAISLYLKHSYITEKEDENEFIMRKKL